MKRLLLALAVLMLGCATVPALAPILMTYPIVPDRLVTEVVLLVICDKPRDMLVIYNDGTYKMISRIDLQEYMLMSPGIKDVTPRLWNYSHMRLCGLTAI